MNKLPYSARRKAERRQDGGAKVRKRRGKDRKTRDRHGKARIQGVAGDALSEMLRAGRMACRKSGARVRLSRTHIMPSLIEKSMEFARAAIALRSPEVDVLETVDVSGETRVPEFFQVSAITPGGIAVLREKTLAKTGNADVGVLDPRTCFVKGTLVRTPSGFKEIQDIRPGDQVLAWNEKTGELTISRVQQTFVRTTDAIYKVSYEDGTVIETTWSHPFYVAGQGWVKGKDLRAGMRSPTATAIAMHNERVAMSGGTRLPVHTVAFHAGARANNVSAATVSLGADLPGAVGIASVEVVPGTETVYNFAVEEEHNYFVSTGSVLVHNEEYSPDKWTKEYLALMQDLEEGSDAKGFLLTIAQRLAPDPRAKAVLMALGLLDDGFSLYSNAADRAKASADMVSTLRQDPLRQEAIEVENAQTIALGKLNELRALREDASTDLYAAEASGKISRTEMIVRQQAMFKAYAGTEEILTRQVQQLSERQRGIEAVQAIAMDPRNNHTDMLRAFDGYYNRFSLGSRDSTHLSAIRSELHSSTAVTLAFLEGKRNQILTDAAGVATGPLAGTPGKMSDMLAYWSFGFQQGANRPTFGQAFNDYKEARERRIAATKNILVNNARRIEIPTEYRNNGHIYNLPVPVESSR